MYTFFLLLLVFCSSSANVTLTFYSSSFLVSSFYSRVFFFFLVLLLLFFFSCFLVLFSFFFVQSLFYCFSSVSTFSFLFFFFFLSFVIQTSAWRRWATTAAEPWVIILLSLLVYSYVFASFSGLCRTTFYHPFFFSFTYLLIHLFFLLICYQFFFHVKLVFFSFFSSRYSSIRISGQNYPAGYFFCSFLFLFSLFIQI